MNKLPEAWVDKKDLAIEDENDLLLTILGRPIMM